MKDQEFKKLGKKEAMLVMIAADEQLSYLPVYRKDTGKYAGKQVEGTELPDTLTWVKPKS